MPWSPTDLGAALVAWYKADVGALNGGTGVQATNGQTVDTWQDQSGNGNHVVPRFTNSPTMNTTGINSKPGVLWSASNATALWTAATDTFSGFGTGSTASVFIMGTLTGSDNGGGVGYAAAGQASGVGANSGVIVFSTGGAFTWAHAFSSGTVQSVTTNTPTRMGMILDGVNATPYANNVAGTSDALSFSFASPGTLEIGGPGNNGWDGLMGEVIITNTALNSTDRANLDAYLVSRFSNATTPEWEFDQKGATSPTRVPRRASAVAESASLVAKAFPFLPHGFPIQPPQPPPRPMRRAAAMFATGPRFDPRPAAQDIPWRNAGWEIQPVQPPHRRVERYGAIIVDEDGNESPFVPSVVAPTVIDMPPLIPKPRPRRWVSEGDAQPGRPISWQAFTEIQPPPPPSYPKVRQRGTAASGSSEFASFDLQAFMEVQGWQPRPIRRVQSMLGAEVPFPQTTLPPVVTFYEQSTPALRTRPRLLSTAIVSPEQPLVAFFPQGWEVQSFQPPHRRPERGGGAIAEGSDGTDLPLFNWRNFGWEVQPPQPPHPRREKFGAIVPKEDGTENVFTFIAVPIVWGFEPSMPLPGRRKVIGFPAEDVIASPFAIFRPYDLDARPAALFRRAPVRQVEQPGLVVVPPAGTPAWGWADLPAVLRRASGRFAAVAPAAGLPEPASARLTGGWEIPPVLVQRPRRRPAWALDGDPREVFIPPVPPPAWEWQFNQPLTTIFRVPRAGAVIIPWSGGEIIIPVLPQLPYLCFTADGVLWEASSRISPACVVGDAPGNGVLSMGTYEIQTALQIIGTFANSLTGAAADPTTVKLYLKDPQGTVQTFVYGVDPVIVRDEVGQYHYNMTATIHGVWTYKWQGTGNVVATSPDTTFTVKASTLIPG